MYFHIPMDIYEFQLKAMQNITSNNSPKRIPCSVIKPIVEIVKSFFCQKLGCAIVEVWIKFMNNALKSQNREQTGCKGCKNKHTVVDQITNALPVKGKIVPVRTMKAFWGSGDIALPILNLSTRIRRVVNLTLWPLHT
jgi:hypothetical protein